MSANHNKANEDHTPLFQTPAAGLQGAQPCKPAAGKGAPPSITAPANCIRPLRHGVDSLYLSFQGVIDPEVVVALEEAKLFAQGPNEEITSLGCQDIGEHHFTVLPRGRGRFAFVLEDNWFSIQVSKTAAGGLPLALVQVRSEYLTDVGPENAIRTASRVVEELGDLRGSGAISRIDLFADFTTDVDLAAIPGAHWVKRSKKRTIHEECDQITGISFGSGNELSARLYDKTRELAKSGKFYLESLWAEQGWEKGQRVWRMEFQIRREGLPDLMKGHALDALALAGNLWCYLCDEWLRLAIPSVSDDTRSRWPADPLWLAVARIWDVDPAPPPLTRVEKTRAPEDDYLFRAGIAGLTSFMAREGITDYAHGLGEFLHAMERYHNDSFRPQRDSLLSYMDRKARLKARRYNVRIPRHDEG